MFWIICAALAGVVAIAIAAPLMRRQRAGAEPAAAFDLRVYRDQLREVERDLERGVIDASDAERLRVEIGRKVLAADRALERETSARRAPGGMIAIAVLAVLIGGAVALYEQMGAPERGDEPIARRIANAQAIYDQRPTQAEAEAAAPKPKPPENNPEFEQYLALVDKLRTAVAQNPDDPRGLELLAQHERGLGNLVAAKQAQTRLVTLRGDQASEQDLSRLTDLTVEAAGGLITAEGESAIARTLALNPHSPQGRYYAGLLQIQSGRPDLAFPLWAGLLEEGPPDAPWLQPIRFIIGDLAWFAGRPDYTPPEAGGTAGGAAAGGPAGGPMTAKGMPALPGPDADAMAAAADMTPEQQQQMIDGMVKGLEDRLATQGGLPEEWARLIGALAVKGDQAHAREILTEARSKFAADPQALVVIDGAAGQAGLQ
jgi:cytochrome c-type biogenesis protein CcmH